MATASATDNCDANVTVDNDYAGITMSCNNEITVSFDATDVCTNKAVTKTAKIKIIDTTIPVVTANGDKTVDPGEGECGAYVTVSASATDNCDQDLIPIGIRSDGKDLDDLFPVGTTTITWNVSDDCGNPADAVTQKVTVNPIQVCGTYNGTLFTNTSVKTVGKKQYEVPAEIAVSIAIPADELVCGTDGIVVSFKLEPDPSGGVTVKDLGPVTSSYDSETAMYIFSQKYSVALGTNLSTSITVTWTIGSNKYTNKDCTDKESLVTVFAPADDFVTGGGYIILSDAVNGGSWVGDVGTKNNFGFNIKWSRNFSRLQGNFNTIWRTEDGRRFQARTYSAGALVVYKKLDATGKLIGYQANITYTNVNIRELCDACVNGTGNGTVILTVYDWGEPGSNWVQTQPDQIGFVILDNKGIIVHATNVYNNADGMYPVVVQYLDAGNIQVHANPTNLENKSAEITTGIVPDIEFADLKVYPNPFSEKLRFGFVSPVSVNCRIDLYDMTGRLVKTIFEQPIEGGVSYEAEFSPEAIISGMYFYRVTMGEAITNGKVVFKKE